jgi:DNA helicase-2/ATP-dependent DNA helicase PcrA
MLVVAGAGTGKTTVLTHRIAYLIGQGHAPGGEVLAVTFTDKAAEEMKVRAAALLDGHPAGALRTSTFHAYCQSLLERSGNAFGVMTKEDLWVYLRRNIEQLPLDRFRRAADPGKFLHDLLRFFERCLDELVSAADYCAYVERLARDEVPLPRVYRAGEADTIQREEIIARCREIARVYAAIERMLEEENLGTFGHQIVRAVELLRRDNALLETERRNGRFLLVDEFQDCNTAQLELLSLLAGEERNVFVVGDPDQAIYRFRGASSAAFREFLARFRDSKYLSLVENQRSLSPVLDCAHAVIRNNPEPLPKLAENADFRRRKLTSAREARMEVAVEAPRVEIALGASMAVEAMALADSVEERHSATGRPRRDVAVLYRSHRHREAVIREFATRGIPFVVVGVDVLETAAVRNLVALLRCLHATDDNVSLFRLAMLPQSEVDPEALRTRLVAAERGTSLTSILEGLPAGKRLLKKLRDVRSKLQPEDTPMDRLLGPALSAFPVAEADCHETRAMHAFVREWQKKPTTRTKRLAEFLDFLELFAQAGGMVALPSDESIDGVQLMTVHAAKGLEFPHVYIVRASSPTFPTAYRAPLFQFPDELVESVADLPPDGQEFHLQEERRLFYVAMTRARDFLMVCAKRGSQRAPMPKGFLVDLSRDAAAGSAFTMRNVTPPGLTLAAAGEDWPAWLELPPRKELAGEALSASAIDTYETCPLQFRIARDFKLPGEPTAAIQFGAAMHTVLHAYYESVRLARPQTTEQVLEGFRLALDQSGIEDDFQRELYQRQGLAQLRAFLGARAQEATPEVLANERSFKAHIGGAAVTGRVDRIDRLPDGRARIIDYKTGKSKSQEDAEESFQLSIYAIAAQRVWQLEPAALAFYNLDNNTVVEAARTPAALAEAEQRVADVAQKIREGRFDAKPGGHCQWCAYRSVCPEKEEKVYQVTVAMEASGVN